MVATWHVPHRPRGSNSLRDALRPCTLSALSLFSDMETVTTTEPAAGRRLTNRELLMQRLVEGFQDAENFRVLEALVEGTSGVSLRLLDFFLCHYSVKHNVQYSLPQDPLPFNVHDEYDQMLTAYGKVLFDCFGRKQRSVLTRGDKTIKTSAGQVCGHETIASIYSTPTHHCPSLQCHMVSWAIEKRVMAYVIEHSAEIRQDLKLHSKKTRQDGGRRKNKAVIQKRDPIDRSFCLPASWHSGRKFKMSFSLKKSR